MNRMATAVGGYHSREFKVTSVHGVFLKTLYDVARKAGEFEADITISCPGATADAKHVLQVMKLFPEKGDKIRVEARGRDSDRAIEGLSGVLTSTGLQVHRSRRRSRVAHAG